jgi:hypothetical protein
MNRLKVTFVFLLAVTSIVGCRRERATGTETHEFSAVVLADGSLKLEFFRNSRLSEQRIVAASKIAPGNSISAIHYNEPTLGPWCIVECHIDPSSIIIVAWNPSTDEVQHSPAEAWGIIASQRGDALVTIFRPHLNTPLDAPDKVLFKGVELAEVPHYGWKRVEFPADRLCFAGLNERGEPVSATVMFSGKWTNPAGLQYDVVYVCVDLQMHVAGTNVGPQHRLFLVRNGRVELSVTCSRPIVVQDNQLLEINEGGAGVPWPEAETATKNLGMNFSVTRGQALDIVMELPEARAWSTYIRSASKGRARGASWATSETPERIGGIDCWPVTFGESLPDIFHRWEYFAVDAASGEVFVVVLGEEGEELRPLSQWRSEGECGRTGKTLLTENYRVTLYDFSGEGEVSHNKMVYHGVSRKTGKDIFLVGSTWHHEVDGVPTVFRGWVFRNGDMTYWVHQGGLLSVVEGDARVLVDKQGKWQ